jgi:hypothetical protein
MNTHHTHHTTTHPQGKEVALRWLAQQLRWERLLDDLRTPTPPTEQEEAA